MQQKGQKKSRDRDRETTLCSMRNAAPMPTPVGVKICFLSVVLLAAMREICRRLIIVRCGIQRICIAEGRVSNGQVVACGDDTEVLSKNHTLGLVFLSLITVAVAACASCATIVCASRAVFILTHAWLFPIGRRTAATLVSLSAELPDYVEEGLFDIDAVFRRGFDKVTAQVFCQGLTFLCRYFTLSDAIAFVSDEHDRRLAEYGCGCAEW